MDRKHPDIFTPEEAADYLHLDSVRKLEACEQEAGLVGQSIPGIGVRYHREDLDKCAMRMAGRDRGWNQDPMARPILKRHQSRFLRWVYGAGATGKAKKDRALIETLRDGVIGMADDIRTMHRQNVKLRKMLSGTLESPTATIERLELELAHEKELSAFWKQQALRDVTPPAPCATVGVPAVLSSLVPGLRDFGPYHRPEQCVYFLVAGSQVIYVGQTADLHARLANHYALGKRFDRVFFLPVARGECLEVESAFIARFAPPLNDSRPSIPVERIQQICDRFGMK